MDKVEAQVKRLKGKSFKAGPPDKAGQQYRQWVEELYKDSVADGDRYLVTFTEHLREYHVALTLNTYTRMKNARKYLDKYFKALDTKKFTETDKNLLKLFNKAMEALETYIKKDGEPQNPRLMKLKELLLENYENDKPKQGKEDQCNKKEDGDGEGKDECKDDSSPEVTDRMDEKTMKGTKDVSEKECDDAKEDVENEESKLGNEEDATLTAKESAVKCGSEDSNQKASLEKMEECSPEDASSEHSLQKRDDLGNSDASQTVQDAGESEYDNSNKSEAKKVDDAKTKEDSSGEDNPSDEKSAYHPEWEGPKGILFTRTRESTDALLDWIKETEELNAVLRPEPLVGSGDGNSKCKCLFFSGKELLLKDWNQAHLELYFCELASESPRIDELRYNNLGNSHCLIDVVDLTLL